MPAQTLTYVGLTSVPQHVTLVNVFAQKNLELCRPSGMWDCASHSAKVSSSLLRMLTEHPFTTPKPQLSLSMEQSGLAHYRC